MKPEETEKHEAKDRETKPEEFQDLDVETVKPAGEQLIQHIPKCLVGGPMNVAEIRNSLKEKFAIDRPKGKIRKCCHELVECEDIIEGSRKIVTTSGLKWESVYFLSNMIGEVERQDYGKVWTLHTRTKEAIIKALHEYFKSQPDKPLFLTDIIQSLKLSPDIIMEVGQEIASSYGTYIVDDILQKVTGDRTSLEFDIMIKTKVLRGNTIEDMIKKNYYTRYLIRVHNSGDNVAKNCQAYIDLEVTEAKHKRAVWTSKNITTEIMSKSHEDLILFNLRGVNDSREPYDLVEVYDTESRGDDNDFLILIFNLKDLSKITVSIHANNATTIAFNSSVQEIIGKALEE